MLADVENENYYGRNEKNSSTSFFSLLLRQFISFMTNSLHKKVVLSTLHVFGWLSSVLLLDELEVDGSSDVTRKKMKVSTRRVWVGKISGLSFFCFNIALSLTYSIQILESQVVFYGLSLNWPPLILFFSNCSTKRENGRNFMLDGSSSARR